MVVVEVYFFGYKKFKRVRFRGSQGSEQPQGLKAFTEILNNHSPKRLSHRRRVEPTGWVNSLSIESTFICIKKIEKKNRKCIFDNTNQCNAAQMSNIERKRKKKKKRFNTCFGPLTYFRISRWSLNYKVSQFGPLCLLPLPLLVLSVTF